jgi:hypothetical protein
VGETPPSASNPSAATSQVRGAERRPPSRQPRSPRRSLDPGSCPWGGRTPPPFDASWILAQPNAARFTLRLDSSFTGETAPPCFL